LFYFPSSFLRNFEQYLGTHSEAYENSLSDDEMDYEAPAFVYGNLIDLADANSTTTPEINVIKDEVLHDTPVIVPEKKYQIQIYKKYGEANIASFFSLTTEEGLSVPKAAKQTGIPRSTAYELKGVWNDNDGTVYPSGCIKRKSKANSNTRFKNTKLNPKHTAFLIEQIDNNPCITITDVSQLLCYKFEGLSISSSAVRKHMVNYCKISLKNIKPYNLKRNSDRTIPLNLSMPGSCWCGLYEKLCVFR
jgi:transposase